MITVEKVIKMNGELIQTRKHPFEVEDHTKLEEERKKLEKHYDCQIIFIYREPIQIDHLQTT